MSEERRRKKNIYMKEYYQKNKEELKEKNKRYKQEHKKEYIETARIWGEKNKEKLKQSVSKYRKNHPEKVEEMRIKTLLNKKKEWEMIKNDPDRLFIYNEKKKKRMIDKRLRAIEYMGGKCEMCGIDDVRVLDIHHANGGGKDDHNMINRKGFKEKVDKREYVLLCANCHRITHRE